MKKILLLSCILLFPYASMACEGVNIRGYCISIQTMNWYSAYSWCKEQGMNLLNVEDICPSLSKCPELKLSAEEQAQITEKGGTITELWMNTSYTSQKAYSIMVSSGQPNNNLYNGNGRMAQYNALCK